MKNCELCKGLARMHCESDGASLCWNCDYEVHSANFLVARHSRTLLCQVCQSPTPWTASGMKLGPTVSVCDACVMNHNKINVNEESETTNESDMESDDFDGEDDDNDADEEYDDNDADEEYDCEEDTDTDSEDNQVVPWAPSTPPPLSTADSSSNSDGEPSYSSSSISSFNQREAQRKRTREDTDRYHNVNYVSTPSQRNADTPLATVTEKVAVSEAAVDSVDSLSTMVGERSSKMRRIIMGQHKLIPGSKSWVVLESVKRLHGERVISSEAAICELRRLSEDSSAVDYDESNSI